MLYDFIITDKNAATPMYRQIYTSIRQAIENGNLKQGDKLPSIRRLCQTLNISKTTVIAAYDRLAAEGYVLNRPQSGYYVAADFETLPAASEKSGDTTEQEKQFYEYDFSTKSIDSRIIDLSAWRKEIKNIINSTYLQMSYGDVQGEEALRSALQKYALGVRSVNASAARIVVAAGTQAVLCLLCSLIGCQKRVAIQRDSFIQSEYVFRSFQYDICYFESDDSGVTLASLNEIQPDIILLNPNFSGTAGVNMPLTRRLEIIRWAAQHHALILEDDYNGELRYSSHPLPCVQSYDADHTVYIGSFSKVLLPSVRISYMVLPEDLSRRFDDNRAYLNQTASKTEQLALAAYLNSGKIDAHIRRARRIYLEKSRDTLFFIQKYFPDSTVVFHETSLYYSVRLPFQVNRAAMDAGLEQSGIRLMTREFDENVFGISFSGIPSKKIEEGLRLTSEIIYQAKNHCEASQ
ncbi:MAG: PLP-dependent aminotransferase family protein [Ruminococcus sp.]|nr:PLP-dependent aminotransferase family protein [Ruminococcus sp.]